MRYNIYKTISDEKFAEIKEVLESISVENLTAMIEGTGFLLNRSHDYNDHLNISITKKSENMFSNISFVFNDNGKEDYTLVIIKTIDIENKRKYKRIVVRDDLLVNEIKQNSEGLFLEAVEIVNNLQVEDFDSEISLY